MNGSLDAKNFLRLYKTNLDVKNTTINWLTYNNSKDWWHMYINVNGIAVKPTKKYITLEDYMGNMSEVKNITVTKVTK